MGLRRLKRDREGVLGMSFETPLVTVGGIMIALVSLATLFHSQGVFQGMLWPDIYALGPLLIGAGVMLVLSNWTFDYRWLVLAGFAVGIAWYILVVL